jgi:putative protein-disulfide isomerase
VPPLDIEFVYVGDPMCSWCWGFAPVLERMREVYDIPIRVVVGGLRPGPEAEVLDDRLSKTLGEHWEHVAEASGQPFDHSFLDRRDGWVYDTEVPAIAVVTMRELDDSAALDFHTHLQRSFYSAGVDITDREVYPELLAGFDVDPDKFTELFGSDEMKKRAWADFAESRSKGVAGFPSLLIREGDEWGIITRGYMPAERMLPALSDWLLNRYVESGEALFCEPGTVC